MAASTTRSCGFSRRGACRGGTLVPPAGRIRRPAPATIQRNVAALADAIVGGEKSRPRLLFLEQHVAPFGGFLDQHPSRQQRGLEIVGALPDRAAAFVNE